MTATDCALRRVYWETTAGCNLRCLHCRRVDALAQASPEEMTTEEAQGFIRQLSDFGHPVLIFSGGEPLMRRDLFDLFATAREGQLPLALSTNGTLVQDSLARDLKKAGVYYASISLDGADPGTHDAFRGGGSFFRALQGMESLQKAGIKVQINFTVTRSNVSQCPDMWRLAQEKGAIALYLFLLVPVGCGVHIADSQMISAEQVEAWLGWVRERDKEGPLPIKAICAPQYYRVEHASDSSTPLNTRKGCLAAWHMCFVSHKGEVHPCGYLPAPAGNVKTQRLKDIWQSAPTFLDLRDPERLGGKCGRCSYKVVCGGCRARAWSYHQNLLAEEPRCHFDPPGTTDPRTGILAGHT